MDRATTSFAAPARRWSSRLALFLAIIAALVNAAMVSVYGTLMGSVLSEATQGDGPFMAPPDVPSATVALLVAGGLWYVTPVLWLVVMVLWLTGPGGRAAYAAVVLATLSLLAFVLLFLAVANVTF